MEGIYLMLLLMTKVKNSVKRLIFMFTNEPEKFFCNIMLREKEDLKTTINYKHISLFNGLIRGVDGNKSL